MGLKGPQLREDEGFAGTLATLVKMRFVFDVRRV